MFERLSGARADAWEPRAGWVRALLETGRSDPAAKVCEDYLTGHPDHPGALIALAQAALEFLASLKQK